MKSLSHTGEDTTGYYSSALMVQKVMFVENSNLSSGSEFISYNALSVVATSSLEQGQKLLVDYDINYSLT